MNTDGRFPPEPASKSGATVGTLPTWNNNTRGRLVTIDWGRWLDSDKHIDPYLVWADVSSFAGFDRGAEPTLGGGTWPILVECAKECSDELPSQAATTECKVSDIFAGMEVPGLYKVTGQDGRLQMRSKFFTARIAPNSVEQLLTSCDVRRFQLGLPRLYSTDPAPRESVGNERGKTPRIVVGIIDDGCAFAHPAFCDAQGKTRVHFLWDQDAARTAALPADPGTWRDRFGWSYPVEAGYGAELRYGELVAASTRGFASWTTEAAYASVNYAPLRLDPETHGTMLHVESGACRPVQSMRRSSHGASVMYLLAGADERIEPGPTRDGSLSYVRPLQSQRALFGAAATPVATLAGKLPNDYATQWPIVFVQLPTRTILDTSGGSLGVHVLDGLRYISDRASQIPYDDTDTAPMHDGGSVNPADQTITNKAHEEHRLVVTISYGAVAGPHDGTSIIEQAIVDFVAMRKNTWVCLAAGNSHKTRTHARLSLKPGEDKSFLWRVGADNPLQSFLEVWLPDLDSKGEPLHEKHRAQLIVTVEPPGGLPAQRVCMGELWTCEATDAAGTVHVLAGAIFSRTVAQGLRGTMVLLAVAATRPTFGKETEPVGCHGDWIVNVFNGAAADTPPDLARESVVHAWAERNDLLYGNQRGQQGTVVSTDPVPEPTEYTPEARLIAEQHDSWVGHRQVPDDYQRRSSLGSLSGGTRKSKSEFFQPDRNKGRWLWPAHTVLAMVRSPTTRAAVRTGTPSRATAALASGSRRSWVRPTA
jgi:hypothetical protein